MINSSLGELGCLIRIISSLGISVHGSAYRPHHVRGSSTRYNPYPTPTHLITNSTSGYFLWTGLYFNILKTKIKKKSWNSAHFTNATINLQSLLHNLNKINWYNLVSYSYLYFTAFFHIKYILARCKEQSKHHTYLLHPLVQNKMPTQIHSPQGGTQYKRLYGDVPLTWVAKSASWYMNDHLIKCKIQYTYEWIDLSKFPQIWAKTLENFGKIGWFCSNFGPKFCRLENEWVTFSWKIGLPSNSAVVHPYHNQTWVPPSTPFFPFSSLPYFSCHTQNLHRYAQSQNNPYV